MATPSETSRMIKRVPEWPSILAAGLSSGLAGFGGSYVLSRATLHGIEAEMTRLKHTHGEEHRRHRQGMYHDYLDSLSELGALTTFATATPNDMTEWMRGLYHRQNALLLVAAEPVRDIVRADVRDLLARWGDAYDRTKGSVPDKARGALATVSDELVGVRARLTDAMRSDVGWL